MTTDLERVGSGTNFPQAILIIPQINRPKQIITNKNEFYFMVFLLFLLNFFEILLMW